MRKIAASLLALCLALPVRGSEGPRGFVDVRSEGDILSHWLPEGGLLLPPYPPLLAGSDEDACVNLGYLVDKDGRTSSFVLLKAWGEHAADDRAGRERLGLYAQSAAAAVQRWRFAPAGTGGGKRRPMYTSATFAFSRDDSADRHALRARCAVGDLRDFVDRAFAKAQARGNLLRGQMDRWYEEPKDERTHHLRGPGPGRDSRL